LPLVQIPYFLTIAGSGDENYIKYLQNIAEDNKVADKINWAGFYSDDKFELLRANDLFVLPSHDENFGNTVIESLSTGTAVLISRNVGLADYVQQEKMGWLCNTTPQSISDCINDIGAAHKNKLLEIRRNAPAVIYNDFYPENLVGPYISLYRQIINTRH
jgi:glycosyltransferase involved in cell wall biosynthesis